MIANLVTITMHFLIYVKIIVEMVKLQMVLTNAMMEIKSVVMDVQINVLYNSVIHVQAMYQMVFQYVGYNK